MAADLTDVGTRQSVLDGSLRLQLARAQHCADLVMRGASPGVEWLRGDFDELKHRIREMSIDSRELLATVPTVLRIEEHYRTQEDNARYVSRGGQMLSIYDVNGIDPTSRSLVGAGDMPYRVGLAPLAVKILDRSCVILEGPTLDSVRTAMVVTNPSIVKAGLEYLRVARRHSIPSLDWAVSEVQELPLSSRQVQICNLLSTASTDREVAVAMGLSVRTIRTEIRTLQRELGSKNRFDAGFKYARLSTLVESAGHAMAQRGGAPADRFGDHGVLAQGTVGDVDAAAERDGAKVQPRGEA